MVQLSDLRFSDSQETRKHMSADDRIFNLIMSLSRDGLRILCAVLWEGLKQRLTTNETANIWADAVERIARSQGAK